jgi:transglutaminase-like putative cysteine protease
VVGWPEQIKLPEGTASAVGFSPASGSLSLDRPIPPGTTYRLVSGYQSAQDLNRQAMVSQSPADAPYRDLPPGLPPYVTALCSRITRAEPSPVGKLQLLNGYLRGLPYSLDAQPGNSYASIDRMLGAVDAHDDEGYAEQHAAAFAVMARVLGYPARVAVGYRLHDGHFGAFAVTTRDAHAWAEVHFAGYGWVAFDPTDPNRRNRTSPHPAGAAPTPSPTIVTAQPRARPSPLPVLPSPPIKSPDTPISTLLRRGGDALAGLIVLMILAIPAEKARRRIRRRHANTPSGKVIGAWEEAVDRLAERRLPMTRAQTPHELAVAAGARLGAGGAAVPALADTATTAIFAPALIDHDDVRHAWSLERSLRRDLYPGWRRAQRVAARFDPRPLFGRRKSARPPRQRRRARRETRR